MIRPFFAHHNPDAARQEVNMPVMPRGPRAARTGPIFGPRQPAAAGLAGCAQCGGPLLNSVFDTTFALDDGNEQQFLGVPSSMCQPCQQLYLEPQLVVALKVNAGRCLFAIESDQFVQDDFWSEVDAQAA